MLKKKTISFKGISGKIKERWNGFNKRMIEIKKNKEQKYSKALVPGLKPTEKSIVELSPSSVVKSAALILLLLAFIYFINQIIGILLLFFISFLVAAAMDPLVDWMQKKGVPRSITVILVYILAIVVTGIFVTKVVTLIAVQVVAIAGSVGNFFTNLTHGQSAQYPFAKELRPYFDQLYSTVDLKTAVSQIQNGLNILSTQLASISIGLFNVLIILILTFFMTVEEKAIEVFFLSLFPSRYAVYVSTRLEAVKLQIGHWLRGQLLVSLITGLLAYIVLVLLGVNYALTLSIIAGLGMLIPVVGGFIAWAVTFPIVFNQSPALSLWMSIIYFVLNQFEANLLIPYVMNKAVGLSPIIIIFAMMVGGQFLGVIGLILSIPIATTVTIFLKDYTNKDK